MDIGFLPDVEVYYVEIHIFQASGDMMRLRRLTQTVGLSTQMQWPIMSGSFCSSTVGKSRNIVICSRLKRVRLGVVRVTGRFIAWSTVWTGDEAVALDRLEVYMKVRACFGIRGQSIPRKAPGRAYS